MVDPAQLAKVRGRKVPIDGTREAFVPAALPPRVDYSSELISLVAESQTELGRLDALGTFVPSTGLFVLPSLHTEALSSTRIEGTRASISEVFMHAAGADSLAATPPERDMREVVNYKSAMHLGLRLLAELPICTRLVREVHRALLEGTRGEHLTPGEFRTLQVTVGGYMPPPANYVAPLMDEWESFTTSPPDDMPVLVHSAIMHYQFEAIHPFFDGNGRIGRLLIPLLLCAREALQQPLLSMSVYLEANRSEYFDRLLAVSDRGDWNGWVCFFLRGVAVQARRTIQCCRTMIGLRQRYIETVESVTKSPNAVRVVDLLFGNPYITAPTIAASLNVTYQTGRNVLSMLTDLGITDEVQRETPAGAQLFVAPAIMRVLSLVMGQSPEGGEAGLP